MSTPTPVDESDAGSLARRAQVRVELVRPAAEPTSPIRDAAATAFVESCIETVAGSVVKAELNSRGHPKARKLLKVLSTKKNILLTTHLHPDPDALASTQAMAHLLRTLLPTGINVSMSIKGHIAGGINAKFAELAAPDLVPWDEAKLSEYDAFVLLDTHPTSAFCPLPKTIEPTAVIDHHRTRWALPKCPFCDVRVDVGATSSIVFSYFMELEADITPAMGAGLLFAIESDLAGAAGAPGDLDNIALSSLVLIADTRKLYQMRYVDLPRSYYVSYAAALNNAVSYDRAIFSHIGEIDSLEKPAVMADFLLRLETVDWSLVTAVHENRLLMSLRTGGAEASAVDAIRCITKKIGEGGGHRLKAGGYVVLATTNPAEVTKVRDEIKRRLLRFLKIRAARGTPLVPTDHVEP